jgi:hypothetical protein
MRRDMSGAMLDQQQTDMNHGEAQGVHSTADGSTSWLVSRSRDRRAAALLGRSHLD